MTQARTYVIPLGLDAMTRDRCTADVPHSVVEADEKEGPKPHQMTALPQKISHGTFLPRVDVALLECPTPVSLQDTAV